MHILSKALVAFGILTIFESSPILASSFGNDIIYQIITDRFEDGDSLNNCGQNDASLTETQKAVNLRTCDPSRRDWNRYWGGDFQGIQKRLEYLKGLGVTQIWISPVIENARGFAVGDGTLKTAYHGFWGRDWFRLNEHWTEKGTRDFDSLTKLVQAARSLGIGVIVDSVVNHTSPALDAEYGSLYENGDFVASPAKTPEWFHPFPSIRWDLAEASRTDEVKIGLLRDYEFQHLLRIGQLNSEDRAEFEKKSPADLQKFMLQKFMLADLADLDESYTKVDAYMSRAHERLLEFGISGFRMDTARHLPVAYWKNLAEMLERKKPDLLMVGEWFGGGPGDSDSMEFIRNTGITIFDFKLRQAFLELFLKKHDLKHFGQFIKSSIDVHSGLDTAQDIVTFIDNHDMPRMQAEGASGADVMEMLKLLFAVRGVPCVYYGLENFVFNTQDGGRDPYNRDPMRFLSPENAPAQKLLKALTDLRRSHPELRLGKTSVLVNDQNSLLFQRGGDIRVLVMRSSTKRVSSATQKHLVGFSELKFPTAGVGLGQSAWSVRYYKRGSSSRKPE